MALVSLADAPGSTIVSSWWRGLQPAPDLPLTGTFSAGLGSALRALDASALGAAAETARQRLLDVVDDRFTVTVTDEAISVRGLLRHHRVRWRDAEEVVVEPVEAMALRRLGAAVVARRVPVPVLGGLVARLADHLVAPVAAGADRLVDGLPAVVVQVRGRRGEVTLDGPLALVPLLSAGLTEVVLDQAERRGVTITRGT